MVIGVVASVVALLVLGGVVAVVVVMVMRSKQRNELELEDDGSDRIRSFAAPSNTRPRSKKKVQEVDEYEQTFECVGQSAFST